MVVIDSSNRSKALIAYFYLSNTSKLCMPIMSRLKILYNTLCKVAWAEADDVDSTVALWFECFMAAGLSPVKIQRKRKT